jgi:hypothetical protein
MASRVSARNNGERQSNFDLDFELRVSARPTFEVEVETEIELKAGATRQKRVHNWNGPGRFMAGC